MASAAELLAASGPNSVERQRALAVALGDPGDPLQGGPYWTEAGRLLTIKAQQGTAAAMAALGPRDATPTATTLGGIAEKVSYGIENVMDYARDHPVAVGAALGGVAAAGAGVAVYAATRKRKASGKRSRSRKPKFGTPAFRKRYGAKAKRNAKLGAKARRNRKGGAVKDRYKGHRVYRTKRGQPYILLASGKARFVRA